MRFETFHGTDLRRVFDDARAALGEDVMIVSSKVSREGALTRVKVVAARAEDVEGLRRRITPPAPALPKPHGGRGRFGPFVIALVGPTGAGKTTTAAKLALHAQAFAGKRVVFITLDTYRVGALEQMQTLAEIAGLPFEVVYDRKEVVGALKRLDDCDVVIVDTPGRSPKSAEANAAWMSLLAPLSPDEVHLVVPAALRPEAVDAFRALYAPCSPTHLLVSKADELPDDAALAELASRVPLPLRWITDGQAIPDDLAPAAGRVLAALGLAGIERSSRSAA